MLYAMKMSLIAGVWWQTKARLDGRGKWKHYSEGENNILKKDKEFYTKLISDKNKKPVAYLRQSLMSQPQVGGGIVSLVGALAPLIASLFLR